MIEKERRVAIVTDAAADLPGLQELRTSFGVGPIKQVPLFVNIGSDRFIVGESNQEDCQPINNEIFKDRINREIKNKSGLIPKTAAPNETYFDEAYREPIQQGLDVVSVHIGKEMSATIAAATSASKKIEGNRISIFDTQTVSMAQGLMAIEAEKMAANGATKEEIVEMLTDMRERTTLRVVTPNFPFLVASGRVPGATGMIGRVLSLIPILGIDHITEDNKVQKKGMVRREVKSVEWMEDYLVKGKTIEQLAIVDFEATEISDKFVRKLLDNKIISKDKIYRGNLGPITGSHSGPGTWGMAVVRETKKS